MIARRLNIRFRMETFRAKVESPFESFSQKVVSQEGSKLILKMKTRKLAVNFKIISKEKTKRVN